MITIEAPSTGSGRAHIGLDKVSLRRFLSRAQAAVGLQGEVHVLLSDDAALRRLNRLFRGKDKATDVLSFPSAHPATGMAGDLAISLDHAQRQAAEFNHTLTEEVRILLLHGLLHLAGEDHEADNGEMAAREAKLRAALKLPTGLIERVEKSVPLKPVRSAKTTSTQSEPGHRAATRRSVARRRQA